MPFFRSARIELVGAGQDAIRDVHGSCGTRRSRSAQPGGLFPRHLPRSSAPEPGKDLVLLDTPAREAAATGPGSFVGTSFIFSHDAALDTLEGDPRFFFDDSQHAAGAGHRHRRMGRRRRLLGRPNMTLPFAGHPVGAQEAQRRQ